MNERGNMDEKTRGLEAGSEGLLDLGIGNLDFIWC